MRPLSNDRESTLFLHMSLIDHQHIGNETNMRVLTTPDATNQHQQFRVHNKACTCTNKSSADKVAVALNRTHSRMFGQQQPRVKSILLRIHSGGKWAQSNDMSPCSLHSSCARLQNTKQEPPKARFILLTPSVSDKYCRRRLPPAAVAAVAESR